MTIELISPNQWQCQRWQNGGGITHQIARQDDERGMRWRLSIAEVDTDGPFSQLENIERIILLLDGAGFCLSGAGDMPQVLDQPLQAFHFAADSAIDCKLINGPVRDFNIMSRRGELSASLTVLSLVGKPETLKLSAHTFIYVVTGESQLSVNDRNYLLKAQQTLCLNQESGELHITPTKPCQLLVIRLD